MARAARAGADRRLSKIARDERDRNVARALMPAGAAHTRPAHVPNRRAPIEPLPPAGGNKEGMLMRKALNGAIVALGIAGAALAATGTASAQGVGVGVHVGGIGVGFNIGDVAYGYQDGYWDTGHHWHNWHNDQELRDYRNSPHNRYNDWRHDRDPDGGWHS
jgi:hypothetical protein